MYFCTFKRGKGRGIWAFQTERTHQKVFFSTYSLNDTFIRINIYIYICVFRESKSKATHCRKEKWNSDLKLQRLLLKKKKTIRHLLHRFALPFFFLLFFTSAKIEKDYPKCNQLFVFLRKWKHSDAVSLTHQRCL